ncbi:ThuA domain-containing protein [Thalassotalea agarivorans]|uniref:ThuA-like domain-containing protein n=1 Tax=Thalassotalea agarivorans TaxID=349064 RepID=A0A1H9Y7P2_THASX|nr:ThuA domain-containing protein [Thalassotalea agarivorans]SES64793.1 hypothetical protein SAMN05660429_00109 [Thalassotalea agarivorans]
MKVLIALLLLVYLPFGHAEPGKHILVFSKTEGWRHKSIEPAIKQITAYAEKYNIAVTSSEDAQLFNSEQLAKYDAVVFLLTTGNVLNASQQKSFEQYIKNGNGFVGVHSATDTGYDWPWYGKLVGAYFNGHPNDPNVRDALLYPMNQDHAATEMLPTTWPKKDEWYDFKSLNADVQVLINIDEQSYKKPKENPVKEQRPISWYHEYDGGRAFYTGLGHTTESYSEPLFMQHLFGGIQYAIGGNND